MADDLRRRLILHKLEKANEILKGEDDDTLGDLPSFGNPENVIEQQDENPINNETTDGTCSWTKFFTNNERFRIEERNFEFNAYYSLPSSQDALSIPVFICHHGAGSSGLTFANLSKQLSEKIDGKCAIFAFDARGHGHTKPIDSNKKVQYDLNSFIDDFIAMIDVFYEKILIYLSQTKLSLIFVGHSLGGSICTFSYSHLSVELQNHVLGVAMLDIVEEAAILALNKVHHFLNTTPNIFKSYQEAIDWHVHHGLSKCRASAEIAIPALFYKTKSQKVVRITNLNDFEPYWDTWFSGLSHQFVSLPTSKLLLLAGNENLDKELIIGQMQGKYQLVVFQDSGHFIQEDTPSKTSITLIDFWKRNDSKNVTIKSSWGVKK